MNRLVPAAVALAALLLASAAEAHCVAAPGPASTRLLADYNDECQSSGGTNDCRGAHELVALDVQEKWDGQKDVVVFRFLLDKGAAGAKTDTLTLSAPSGAKTFSIQTTDDLSFTGSGFDSVGRATGLGDGTRFAVEATVALAKLGAAGDTISQVKVEAKAGSSTGDVMPGGCTNTALPCPPPVNQECYYNPTTGYRLKGSAAYADITAAQAGDIEVGEETILELTLTNRLDLAQGVTVTLSGAHGLHARFHDPAGGEHGYSDTLRAALAPKQTQTQHLALEGVMAGASGTLLLDLTTDAGGHRTLEVPYSVVASDGTTTTHHHSSDMHPSHKAAGVGALHLPAILLLAALAAVMRRSA